MEEEIAFVLFPDHPHLLHIVENSLELVEADVADVVTVVVSKVLFNLVVLVQPLLNAIRLREGFPLQCEVFGVYFSEIDVVSQLDLATLSGLVAS